MGVSIGFGLGPVRVSKRIGGGRKSSGSGGGGALVFLIFLVIGGAFSVSPILGWIVAVLMGLLAVLAVAGLLVQAWQRTFGKPAASRPAVSKAAPRPLVGAGKHARQT